MKGALVAALLAASPAAAQDRLTLEQCVQSFDAFTALVAMPAASVDMQLDAEGWCTAADLDFTINPGTRGRIENLRWRATDIARFIDAGLAPRSIDIEGRGFRVIPVTGDAVRDYLLQIQSDMQMAFGAAVRWDGVQHVVSVDTAYINFDETNRIEATARIEGADLSDRGTMQTSIATFALRDLTLKSSFDGWFETYAAMNFGPMVLKNNDTPIPEQVTALKKQAIELIAQFPDLVLAEPSRGAMSDFITALPTPRGTAQLQLTTEPAIIVARTVSVLGETPIAQSLVSLLDGANLVFTWIPTGGIE